MALFPVHSAELRFVHFHAFNKPKDWEIKVKTDARVNDAFVLLPQTVDPWKTAIKFPQDNQQNRVWLKYAGMEGGSKVFSAVISVEDSNALSMSNRAVIGFNGGFDWAQGFGDSVKMSMVYGRLD